MQQVMNHDEKYLKLILYVDLKGYFLIKTFLIEVNKASIFESKAYL